MKVLVFGLLTITFVSSGCLMNPPLRQKPIYPDKDLKEILIRGYYSPEDKGRVKELERDMRERGRIKAWESFEEKYPHLLDRGDEGFIYTGKMFCYNETREKNLVFDKNLKARLYDKKGNLLSEDFLRWDGRLIPESQSVISYIPYHHEGYKIHIVSLKGKEEVILEDLYSSSQKELREKSYIDNSSYRAGAGWTFDEKSECHIAPPPI